VPRIVPNLWFDTQALEAAEFYVSIFPNSKIVNVTHYTEVDGDRAGTVLTVDFELDGQLHTAINGGPQFTFDEAVSLLVEVHDQEELDRYWDALLAGGGEESMCGWLKDKYGLSWQISPPTTDPVFGFGDDPERQNRAMQAMYKMRKLDLQALRDAADGKPPVD
jgi:predicted 3-demethylubiquinone-9 3-methyltransferase (glyoxalase superfamily)